MAGYLTVDDVRAAPGRAVLHAARGAPRDPGRRGRPDVHDSPRPHGHGLHPQHPPAGRGLPHRRRPELGRDGRRRPRGPGRGQPAVLPRAAGHRGAPRRCPRWTPRSAPVAGSPTSAAAWAGRRSAWPPATRRPASTGSTSTSPRWSRPGGTRRRPGSRTGSGSRWPTPARWVRTGEYDVVTAFECVHDLPDPVAVLTAMRAMVRPGGTVLVVDERVAETFTAPGDDVERLMYGFSLTCCLPDSLSPSVGRHRHGDAAVDAGRLCGRCRLRRRRGAARRARLLPLLPAVSAVNPVRTERRFRKF